MGEIVRFDTGFLNNSKLIDYSLMVWVCDLPENFDEDGSWDKIMDAPCAKVDTKAGAKLMYFGIVDILQPWTARKHSECFGKTVFRKLEPSAQPPHRYALRMRAFLAIIFPGNRKRDNWKRTFAQAYHSGRTHQFQATL